MMSVRDKFLAVQQDLNNCLLERESCIGNALLALLTGDHFLQLGAPGTGKSLLVRAVSTRIMGCQYYEKLLTAFSVPEELYGPVDLCAYADRGEYRRISAGSLSQAHIGFLDEIWKANSAILNTLLTITNERVIHEVGLAPQPVPLLSLFAASNEVPSDTSLAALDDRFLLREVVAPLADEANLALLLTGQLPDWRDVRAALTLDELRQAQAEVAHVKGTPEIVHAALTLRQALSAEGITVSDRRWGWSGKLLKARAWLDGDAELHPEHCLALAHAWWVDPAHRKVVEREVYKIACPLALRAVEVEDMLAEVYATLPAATDGYFNAKAESVLQQLTDGYHLLQSEIQSSQARNTTRAEQALTTIAGWHKSVSEKLFRNVSRLTISA
jgi:MoxR-like ATPase